MARCTAEESQRTRDRLLDAALEVFWEEGSTQPSLTKVAERAGMTRGAIYGHFKNRADVFDALCERYLSPADVLEQAREAGAADPLGTLERWVVTLLHRMSAHPGHRKMLGILFLRSEAVPGDPVHTRLLSDADNVRHHERELLRRAMDRGQLPDDLDLDLASFVVSSFIGGVLRSLALYDAVDPGPWAEALGAQLIDALRSPALRRA